MISNTYFQRFLPAILFLCLALLAALLHFNGLYDQDAYEYLRQSGLIFNTLYGLNPKAINAFDAGLAGGYPLFAALLRCFVGSDVLALQMVSWISTAAGLWVFERLLNLLAPGVRAESRWIFAGLGLVLAPMFFCAGITSMSDGLGLTLVLAAFFFGFRAFQYSRAVNAVWATACAVLAITTRYEMALLLLPLGIALVNYLVLKKKWVVLAVATLTGLVFLAPYFWFKSIGAANTFGNFMLDNWSAGNFFQRTFNHENGIAAYALPNILFLFFPLAHPAFCLTISGLFFLFKKTDIVLPVKRILLASIVAYLLFLGGLPYQHLSDLLPAYALLLLLLFPAWDRLYCYGFLFFPRLTAGILVTALVLQVFFCASYLSPILSRNRLDQNLQPQLQGKNLLKNWDFLGKITHCNSAQRFLKAENSGKCDNFSKKTFSAK